MGEVEFDIQVVVHKILVLLGVQCLQQCRCRVPPKIGTNFVHFIQHEHRITGAGFFNHLNNASRQGANVGAPVAADFRFVVNAPHAKAHKFAANGPRNGAPQTGLSHSRRTGKTQNGPFGFFFQLAHGQKFQNAVLDIFQVEVVLIQDFLGILQIHVVLGFLIPGQGNQPIDVGAGNGVIRSGRGHFRHALQFLQGHGFHVFRHAGCFNLLAEVFNFPLPLVQLFVLFSQFLLNGFQLFPQ